MPSPFRTYVDLVLPYLSEVLAEPAARSALQALADWLAPVPWGGFECRLGQKQAQVDLHQGIDVTRGDVTILLDHLAFLDSTRSAAISPAWARIRPLCEGLSNPATQLGASISKIGFEFDIGTPGFPARTPSLFVQIKSDLSTLERLATARSVLSAVGQGTPEPGLSAILEQCFVCCSGEARIRHIGAMLAREMSAVRINIEGLTPDQLPGYLQSVGWNYPPDKLVDLFARLFRYTDRLVVCLDVGPTVHPKVGLECALDRDSSQELRHSLFLDYLIEQRLCTPDKAVALQSWKGRTSPTTSTSPWPDRLLIASLLRTPDQFSLFERDISHIKIDYRPGALLEAKGYLEWRHHWFTPGSGDQAPTAVDGKSGQPTATNLDTATTRKPGRRPVDLDGAIKASVDFLSRARNQGGWWRDFDTLMGGSDEWVTAYAGTALATIPDREAQDAAESAWDLLSRHRTHSEGWAFNVFLPTDSDATAWSLRLANALGIGQTQRAQDARLFLKEHTLSDGGIASYLANDCPYLARFLPPGSLAGLCAVHACVTAAAAADEFSQDARNYLRQTQRPDESWQGYWWQDDEYTTALAAHALDQYSQRGDDRRVQGAVRWAARRIDSSGAVYSAAHKDHSDFATALCVQTLVLADSNDGVREPIVGTVRWLVEQQRPDGSWNASARMRVPPPHAIEPENHVEETFEFLDTRRIFTTATVVTALQMAKTHFEAVNMSLGTPPGTKMVSVSLTPEPRS